MTSMPLTLRTMFGLSMMSFLTVQRRALSALSRNTAEPALPDRWCCLTLTIRRRAPCQLLVGRVFICGGLDHGLQDLLVGLISLKRETPLGAVPGFDASPGRTHVI